MGLPQCSEPSVGGSSGLDLSRMQLNMASEWRNSGKGI